MDPVLVLLILAAPLLRPPSLLGPSPPPSPARVEPNQRHDPAQPPSHLHPPSWEQRHGTAGPVHDALWASLAACTPRSPLIWGSYAADWSGSATGRLWSSYGSSTATVRPPDPSTCSLTPSRGSCLCRQASSTG